MPLKRVSRVRLDRSSALAACSDDKRYGAMSMREGLADLEGPRSGRDSYRQGEAPGSITAYSLYTTYL